jgi:hypothetical protein
MSDRSAPSGATHTETVGDVLAGLDKILDEAARTRAEAMAAFVVGSLEEHEALSEAWEAAGMEHRRILTGEWLARFQEILCEGPRS